MSHRKHCNGQNVSGKFGKLLRMLQKIEIVTTQDKLKAEFSVVGVFISSNHMVNHIKGPTLIKSSTVIRSKEHVPYIG